VTNLPDTVFLGGDKLVFFAHKAATTGTISATATVLIQK
jgi:hypothetical protein